MYIIESLIESSLCHFQNSMWPNKNRTWNVYMFKWQRKREVNLSVWKCLGQKLGEWKWISKKPRISKKLRVLKKGLGKRESKRWVLMSCSPTSSFYLGQVLASGMFLRLLHRFFFFFYLKKHQNQSEFLCLLHVFNNIDLQVNLPWLLS